MTRGPVAASLHCDQMPSSDTLPQKHWPACEGTLRTPTYVRTYVRTGNAIVGFVLAAGRSSSSSVVRGRESVRVIDRLSYTYYTPAAAVLPSSFNITQRVALQLRESTSKQALSLSLSLSLYTLYTTLARNRMQMLLPPDRTAHIRPSVRSFLDYSICTLHANVKTTHARTHTL